MSASSSAFSRIMSNTALLVSSRIVNALCSFIYVAWSAQTLGLANFGFLLLITTFVSLICDVTHLQSWQSLLHYGTQYFEKKQYQKFYEILSFCIRSDFISGFIGTILSLVIIYLFGGRVLNWSSNIQLKAMMCSFTILLMNTGWSTGVLRMCNKFKLVSLYEFITTCVRTIATYIGFLNGYGLDYFLFVWCLTQLTMYSTCSVAGIYLVKKYTQGFPSFREIVFTKAQETGIWLYNINTSVNQVLESIFLQGATLAIGASLGPDEAAVYRVARQISNGMVKPAQLMVPTLYPEFIRMRDNDDWLGIKHIIKKTFRIISIFSLFVLLVTYFLGENIINYMLHQKTLLGGSVLFLLVCNAILNIMMVPLEPYLVMVGKVSYVLKIRVAVIVVYFAFLYYFMNVWGLIGSASEIVMSSLIMLLFCIYFVLRDIRSRNIVETTN